MSEVKNSKTFIVASHAHWDREWYSSFQEFRLRLVEMVDELLEILPDGKFNFHSFNLDGQTVVLEDYLEIRPENADKLKKLISDRKLLVGPWYILPDEFLVSGESFIHNLLLGKEISEQFGHYAKVGYLPDCFGHIAQIPQILSGFGIDNAIIWRGLGLARPYPEIYWQGPDGTKSFVAHLVEGYADCCTNHCKTIEEKVQRFKKMVDWHHTYGQANHALLMHGLDHMPIDLDVADVMKTINGEDGRRSHLRQGTFEEFIDQLRKEQSFNWPTLKGMLRDTKLNEKTGAYILNGILSSRIYIKQANAQSQMTLVRWAEPAAVMERVLFNTDRRPFLHKAWMWLLKNQPHDSIGGCSIDAVHRQMMTRFEWCQDICQSIYERTFHKLTSRTSPTDQPCYQLAVFNPMPNSVSETVETQITIPLNQLPEMKFEPRQYVGPTQTIRGIRLTRTDGQPIDAQIVGLSEVVQPYPVMREVAPLRSCLGIKVRFWINDLPPLGFEKLNVQILPSHVVPTFSLLKSHNIMENAHLRVAVDSNGTLNVTEKATGREFKGLNYFEDGGDFGDEYNYSKPTNDCVVTTLGGPAGISVGYDGPDSCTLIIDHQMTVPAGIDITPFPGANNDPFQSRSRDSVILPIRTEVTLGRDAKYLKIRTTVDNRAKWHRLRVVFPTFLKTDVVQAEQQYDVADLPIHIQQPADNVWIEDQPMQHPQQDFVDLTDGKNGLAVFNKGLPEFEVMPNDARSIAVTLLRAVGGISRCFANVRATHAGPDIATPEAQCIGKHVFEYAIYPHKGDWVTGDVLPLARQFAAGLKTFTPLPTLCDSEKMKFSLLSLEGTAVALDACKPVEKGEGVIVRLTNYSGNTQKAKLQINFPFSDVKFARLDETILNDGPKVSGKNMELEIGPKKIVTLMVR